MSSTTGANYANAADPAAAEVERLLPDEVAEQRLTFADILARRRGDTRPGLLFEDQSFTWDEVVREAEKRAVVLRDLRREGRPFHVGLLLENVPDYIFLIGAGALAGATIVGINPTRRGAELAADIRSVDVDLIITDSAQAELLDGLDTGVDADRVLTIDSLRWAEALEAAGEMELPRIPEAEDPAATLLLTFTSGSTGAPKAVICSTGRMAALSAINHLSFTTADVTYNSMPLFHGNAIFSCWGPSVFSGATFSMRRKFSASGFLPDIQKFGATFFNYVGRSLAYILAVPESPAERETALRLVFGTEASPHDRDEFERRFGVRPIESYGSSEGGVILSLTPETPRNSLGVPPEFMDVHVVDPDGRECPPAEFDAGGRLVNADVAIGEIVNRTGAANFEGYYRNPEATAERVDGATYKSGDLGYRDADGYFYFAGRGGDWMRVDSENFAAAPVERILARFPGVALVAVYPVPDPRTGDQVMATVQMAAGAAFDPAEFGRFLGEQSDLGTKWAPRFVRVVEDIPVTATRKIDKKDLRRQSWTVPDAVYLGDTKALEYRLLDDDDEAELLAQYERYGRQPA
ncbi:putative fatty-acid-CoA ligase FadD [Dietzia sp. NCCP-2495]|uniref:AMP-binding protein n=1 Tax=Dietzia sp. NCCP-2495 TaxID=2934675 RepID=UPI0022309A29|nr:AMP-binding protein [Dietzia sp. NCCP-2495]GLB63548.1 putative fatty-acid-CoA ligase FadD [Dietzia sp. NCCP-2495]